LLSRRHASIVCASASVRAMLNGRTSFSNSGSGSRFGRGAARARRPFADGLCWREPPSIGSGMSADT